MSTMVSISPTPMQRFVDSNGNSLVGGLLFTYQAGTTTKYPTYTDDTGDTQNTNPIVLNSRGEASIWLVPSQSYKFVLSPATDTDPPTSPIWTENGIQGNAAVAVGNMTDELGSNGQPGFLAGTDFVAGTATTLTLSNNYGSAANLWVAFDAAEQGADSFSLGGTNNETLTFNAVIPVGTHKVFVKGGTALTIGTPGPGTITDASVSPSAKINASKLAFLQNGAGAVSRTVLSKLQDVVSLLDFGTVGDGVTDDTAAIQSALTYAMSKGKALYVPTPTVSYMTTEPLSISAGLRMFGDGVSPYTSMSSTGANARGLGSWFYFNHTGKGFDIEGGTAPTTLSGMSFEYIGTYRNQPTPNGAAAFAPTVCDYDFYISNADVHLEHVCTLNPYAAVYVTNGNQGRLTVNNLIGQPLQFGIYVDTSFDSCRIENVHFWPYWSEALGVNTYTLTNGQAFVSARSDTAMYSNCFSYGYNKALNIIGNANGTTTAQFSNFNIDDCFDGIIVDPTSSGARLNFSNLSMQGASTNISAIGGGLNAGISVFGSSCNVNFKGVDAGFFGTNVVNIGGTGNIVLFSQARFYTWNVAAGGYTAVLAQAGATVIFDFKPEGGGATALFGGPGTIKAPLDWGQTTGTTDTQGRLTINHNGGMVPNVVSPSVWNDSAVFDAQISSAGATAFTLRFFTTSTGAPLVSTAVTVSWDLKY